MLQIKHTLSTEMKNIVDGLISRLDMAEKRNLELEDMSRETFKTEMQREKILGKKSTQNRMSKHCGTTIKSITLYNGNTRRRQRNRSNI